jgi:hypothetical protein
MSDFSKQRADSRDAKKLITDLCLAHDIRIGGFMRDKLNRNIVGVLIEFVPPINESDLE